MVFEPNLLEYASFNACVLSNTLRFKSQTGHSVVMGLLAHAFPFLEPQFLDLQNGANTCLVSLVRLFWRSKLRPLKRVFLSHNSWCLASVIHVSGTTPSASQGRSNFTLMTIPRDEKTMFREENHQPRGRWRVSCRVRGEGTWPAKIKPTRGCVQLHTWPCVCSLFSCLPSHRSSFKVHPTCYTTPSSPG